MADSFPLAADPSAITTKPEIHQVSIRGSGFAPSRERPQLTTPNKGSIKKPVCSSQPRHQRLSLSTGEHPLISVMDAPLFRDLSISELAEIAAAGQERTFTQNQSLFGEGDPLCWVSIITSGHVKTIRHSAAGKLMILYISGPGHVLDGIGCLPGGAHGVGAHAVRYCRVFSWEVRRFEALSSRYPALRRNSIQLLIGRLRMLEGMVHELATERVPQRLAKVLLRLISHTQPSARTPLVDLTGEELAQMAGTTQFTVSRLLCDWAAQRIIQPERTAILIQNLPGLIAVATEIDSTLR